MTDTTARSPGGIVSALLFFIYLILFSYACAGEHPKRLVSLAPSLTEMVFEIGAGDLLAGVTEHCRYPPEATRIAKVGGYQTPNFEAILSLRPDLVLTLAEHAPAHALLESMGIRYEVFDHRTATGVLDSFTALGKICARRESADRLRGELEKALEPPPGYDGQNAPSLLFVIGRDYGKGLISNATIVGHDRLYETLIAAAGCRNAYRGDTAYPSLSGEGVAVLNPDVIIEGVYAEMGTTLDENSLRADWSALSNLRAIANGRIFYIRSDYVFIPGYRMTFLKRDLARIIEESGATPGNR